MRYNAVKLLVNAKRAVCAGIVGLSLLAATSTVTFARSGPVAREVQQDDYWHYTSVGQFAMTVTNYGVLGQGYKVADQPSSWYKYRSSLPKEQIEHFSYAGIWVGGVRDGIAKVSTAVMDGSFTHDDGGWEYTASATNEVEDTPIFRHLAKIDRRYDLSKIDNDEGTVVVGGVSEGEVVEEGGRRLIRFANSAWDTVVTRSSISDASLNNPYWRYAQLYDPNAISHQDLICAYTDTNTVVPGTGITIPLHDPLRIHVLQETYAWKEPFAEAFNILNYTVTNIPEGWYIAEEDVTVEYSPTVSRSYSAGDTVWTGSVISAPFFGIWIDASVGNMNYTSNYNPNGGPGGRWNWYDNLNNYDDERHLAMQYDVDGDAGWAQSYFGMKVLGAETVLGDPVVMPEDGGTWDVHYHQWTWNGTAESGDYPMPQSEEERYEVMGQDMANPPTQDEDRMNSWMMLLTCGPMTDMAPGDRFNVSFAPMAGLWNGGGSDSEERRGNLYLNAEWAQIAYNGEDRNGNGVLDAGEDLDGNGEITRYILPAAPPSPSLVVLPDEDFVEIYWSSDPEQAIDPITNKLDFEGYRIYGSPKTEAPESETTAEWTLLADFDIDYVLQPEGEGDPSLVDESIVGFNTGFAAVSLDSMVAKGLYTQAEVDSIRQFISEEYGVNVDYRWVNTGVKSGWPRELYYAVTSYDKGDEDNNLQSLESPIVANRTYAFPGTRPTKSGDKRIGVYPNPYYGRAKWDGLTGRDRLIWFRYLPEECEIKIFTIAGELVDTIQHNAATYQGGDVQRINIDAGDEQRAFSGGEHAWDLLTSDDQEVATGLYIFTVEDENSGDVKTGKFLVIK